MSTSHHVKPRIRRHLRASLELIKLTSDLSHLCIDYIVLKGIPLNKLLYGNHLVRKSGDIDILIHLKNISSVHQYLITQGYQLHESLPKLNFIQQLAFLTTYMDEVIYYHPHKNMYLDLKWHTSTMNYFGMSWCLLDNYDVINIHAYPIRTLKPAQNFYYLCTHAAKHHWERRQWLDDLAVFSQKIIYSHEEVLMLAQKTRDVRALLEASILLQQHFNIQLQDIPHSFWDMVFVQIRLYVIQLPWFVKLHSRSKIKGYLSALLGLFLYPKYTQHYHYIKRLLLLRVRSLEQINKLKNPKPYKMVLLSFWPIRGRL